MNWLRKLIGEVVSMMFMMVGITPPNRQKKKDEEK
jgi:hypothetical protein